MVKLFCATRLNIEQFCSRFGDFLLQITDDDTLQNIIEHIRFGKPQQTYYGNGSFISITTTHYEWIDTTIDLHQIQSPEVVEKFQTLKNSFEKRFNIQLIIKLEKQIKFYIGEEIKVNETLRVCLIKIDSKIENKIHQICGLDGFNDYHVECYIIDDSTHALG
jgi:hypothetical protein